jgi:hypothetical protein
MIDTAARPTSAIEPAPAAADLDAALAAGLR